MQRDSELEKVVLFGLRRESSLLFRLSPLLPLKNHFAVRYCISGEAVSSKGFVRIARENRYG